MKLLPQCPGIPAVAAALFALLLPAPSPAAPPIDFEEEIAPILRANCVECHNRNLQKGDVSLATPADFTGATEGLEAIVVPHHPAKSLLLDAISGSDPRKRKSRSLLPKSKPFAVGLPPAPPGPKASSSPNPPRPTNPGGPFDPSRK